MFYIICYPGTKVPIGKDWASRGLSVEEVAERRANNPDITLGVLLGPVSNVLDVECDDDEATASYDKHLGTILTPSWRAKRGIHHLYQYDERLANLPGVVKYEGIEFRLGNGKATHSIVPPSIVDGVQRQWIVSPEQCQPAKLPDPIVETLLVLPPAAKQTKRQTEIPETRKAKVDRLVGYCERVGLPLAGIREDHHGRVFLDLVDCPFKSHPHEDGNPAIVVHPDGSHGFHCFHAKCVEKKWRDIEEAFGPLLPEIIVTQAPESVVAAAIRALNFEPNVYQRGVLTEVVHDAPKPKLCLHDNGAPCLRPIPITTLGVKIASCARFVAWNDKKQCYVTTRPPETLPAAVRDSIEFPGVPVVTGVVNSPILRADGTIAVTQGYDELTGLYLDTEGTYPGLMQPDEAIKLLDDVLVDFPFASPAHRSGWFAALITLLSRSAFAGSAPFFLVDANMSRVGKGLLTDALTMIVEGRRATRYAAPKDQDEMRKAITTVALGGSLYLLFDNIKDRFGGATLENAMTTGRWSDRILGGNRNVNLPLSFIWLGTSNNAALTHDMIGRTCHLRLNTDCEQPALRMGFKHPNLLAHVKKHRKELAIAALSIPAGYIKDGRPNMNLPAWGGFEDWSDLVRNALVWAKLPDPGESRQTLAAEADDEMSVLRQLMQGWEELVKPHTVADAIEAAEANTAPTLKALLADLDGDKHKALGRILRDYRGRVLGGRKFDRTKGKIPKWELVAIGQPA